jgi:methyl coenzyme M reductase gamma subunit
VRDCVVIRYAAKSWCRARRVVARIEATRKGLYIRYVVTNISYGTPAWPYDGLYLPMGRRRT